MSKAKAKKEMASELKEAKAIQTRSVNALNKWGKEYQALNQSAKNTRTTQIKVMRDLVQVRDRITSELPGYFTWKRISEIVRVPEATLKFYYRIGSHKEVHEKFVKEGALYAFKSTKREPGKRGRQTEGDKLVALHKALNLSGENVSNFVQLIQRLHPTLDTRCKSCGFPSMLVKTNAGFKDTLEGSGAPTASEKVSAAIEVNGGRKVSQKELAEAQAKLASQIMPFAKHSEKGSARTSVITGHGTLKS